MWGGVLAEHDAGGSCFVGAVSVLNDLLEAFPPGLGGDFHGLKLVLGVAWVGDALPSKNSSLIVIKSIMTTPPLFNRIDYYNGTRIAKDLFYELWKEGYC